MTNLIYNRSNRHFTLWAEHNTEKDEITVFSSMLTWTRPTSVPKDQAFSPGVSNHVIGPMNDENRAKARQMVQG